MYCEHFGLRRFPFEERADIAYYFSTAETEETLAAMSYAVEYRRGLTFVLGEAGTGKTLTARVFARRASKDDAVVIVTVPTGGEIKLLRDVCKGFGITVTEQQSTRRYLAKLRRSLLQRRQAENTAVLLIDQAENLTPEQMTLVAAVHELREDDNPLVEIVLLGQPQFADMLNDPKYARLRQQVFGQRLLTPLSREETNAYIRHRLQASGAGRVDVFSPQAVNLVHDFTAGNPRLINNLCNACLVAAYGAGEKQVQEQAVREVAVSLWPGQAQAKSMAVSQVGAASPEPISASGNIDADAADSSYMETAFPTPETSASGYEGISSDMGMITADAADRLECAVRRAERSRASFEAHLTQSSNAEEQLLILSRNADRVADKLTTLIQKGGRAVSRLEKQADAMLHKCEERIQKMEFRLDRTQQAVEEATRHEDRVHQACTKAEQVESHLGQFAEDLVEKMESAQEKIALLMTGLDAGESTHSRLEAMSKEVADFVDESMVTVREHREGLTSIVEQAAGLNTENTKANLAALAAQRSELQEAASSLDDQLRGQRESMQATLQDVEAMRAGADETLELVSSLAHQNTEAQRLHECWNAQRGEHGTLISESNAAMRELTALLEQVGGSVTTLNLACERVDNMRPEMKHRAVVLDRIEQAGERAERMRNELSRVLSQASAVHESVKGILPELTSKGGELTSHSAAASTLVRQLSQANQEGQVILQQCQRAAGSLHQELDSIREVSSATQSSIDTTRQQVTEVQQSAARIDGRIAEGISRSSAMMEELQELNTALQTQQNDSRQTLEAMQTALAQSQGAVRHVDKATRHSEQQASLLAERSEQVGAVLQQAEAAAGTLTALRQEAEASIDRVESQSQSVAGSLQQLQAEVDSAMQQMQDQSAETGHAQEALSEMLTQMRCLHDATDQRAADLQEANEQGDMLMQRIGGSTESISRISVEMAQLLRQADGKMQGMREVVEQSGDVQTQVQLLAKAMKAAHKLTNRLERSRRAADSTQSNIDQRYEAGIKLQQELADIEAAGSEVVDRQRELVAQGTQQIEELTARARRQLGTIIDAGRSTVRDAADVQAAKMQQQVAADETRIRATGRAAMIDVERVLTQANEVSQRVTYQLAEAERQCESALADGRRQLGETIAQAQQELQQAQQANSQLLHETGEAMRSFAGDIEQATEASRSNIGTLTRKAVQGITRLAGKAKAGLDKVSQQAAEHLGDSVAHGAQRMQQAVDRSQSQLDDAVQRASAHVHDDLTRGEARMQELVDSSQQRLEQSVVEVQSRLDQSTQDMQQRAETTAEDVQARLVQAGRNARDSVDRSTRQAEKIEESLHIEGQSAEKVLQNLETIGEQAGQICTQLDERLMQLAEQISRADRAGQSIDDQSASIEQTGQVLQQLLGDADELTNRLAGINKQREALEGKIDHAIRHPQQVIEAALKQTAKLETVCQAVRKIFAGLSRTAVDAQKQQQSFEAVSREAADRLRKLQTETTRAGRSLHQWVQEAVHAQARLSETLGMVPAVQQTHPREGLLGLSQAADLAPRVGLGQDSLGEGSPAAKTGMVGEIKEKPVEGELRYMSRRTAEGLEDFTPTPAGHEPHAVEQRLAADQQMAAAADATADAEPEQASQRGSEIASLIADARRAAEPRE